MRKVGFFARLRILLGLLGSLRLYEFRSAERLIRFRFARYSRPKRFFKLIGWTWDQMWNAIPRSMPWVDLEGDISTAPLWLDAANPLENHPWADRPDARLPDSADVVVVGAGFGGSAVAYHWSKQSDESLVVLDAGEVACGAAGRNGGVVVMAGGHLHGYFVYETVMEYLAETQPELTDEAHNVIAERFTDAYVNALQTSHEMIRDTIEREGIACDYERRGWVFFTDNEDQHHVHASLKLAARLGHSDWVPRSAEEIYERCGVQTTLDGAESMGSATWHPARWVWGILGAALAKPNIHLFARTPVERVERKGDGYIVHTARGRIRARCVVNATEAHTATLFGDFLEPFPDLITPYKEQAMHAEGGPASMKRGVAVTGPLGWFGRLPGGGMIFGSDNTPIRPADMDNTRASRFITRTRCARICDVWGQAPMRLTHEWTGVTCNTPDKYPIIGSLDGHRLYMLGGFAGAGSACSFIAGETIVKHLLGRTDEVVHHPEEFFSPFRFTNPDRYGKR